MEQPKPVEVHPPRAKLIDELTSESVQQTVDALPSFLDEAMASVTSSRRVGSESYEQARYVYPRMLRVRKLLGARDSSDRSRIIEIMTAKLTEPLVGYRQAHEEHHTVFVGRIGGRSELIEYDRKRAFAGVAVYILTEWDQVDALPHFLAFLEEQDPLPVNRLFLMYSAHLLIGTLPKANYTPAQRERYPEYKRLATHLFPSAPERTVVPAWNANYDEADWRRTILGQKIPYENQPTICLRIYPDLSHLEDSSFPQSLEEVEIFQRVLISFLRAK